MGYFHIFVILATSSLIAFCNSAPTADKDLKTDGSYGFGYSPYYGYDGYYGGYYPWRKYYNFGYGSYAYPFYHGYHGYDGYYGYPYY